MQGGLTVDTYHEIKMNPELDLFANTYIQIFN